MEINKITNKTILAKDILKKANGFKELHGYKTDNCIVLEHYGSEVVGTGKQKSLWRCLCNCGNTFIARGNSITQGRTTSCGCISRQRTIQFNKDTKTKTSYNSFSDVFNSYKRGAKVRNLEFSLTKEQFFDLATGNCHYCESHPYKYRKKRTKGEDKIPEFYHNGVDRVDSNIGYIISNVVSCCSRCNRMKGTLTISEFIFQIEKIHRKLNPHKYF